MRLRQNWRQAPAASGFNARSEGNSALNGTSLREDTQSRAFCNLKTHLLTNIDVSYRLHLSEGTENANQEMVVPLLMRPPT